MLVRIRGIPGKYRKELRGELRAAMRKALDDKQLVEIEFIGRGRRPQPLEILFPPSTKEDTRFRAAYAVACVCAAHSHELWSVKNKNPAKESWYRGYSIDHLLD